MATDFQIRKLPNGLRVKVRQNLQMWERLLAATIAAMIVGMTGVSLLKRWWWLLLSPITAIAVFVFGKTNKAELQVTNVEFISRGELGRRVQTPRIVYTADVRGLEFCGGGQFHHPPDGLYVVKDAGKRLLILPFLDFRQAQEVIGAIETRFPGLAQLWREKPR
jgi:hypothetical protein